MGTLLLLTGVLAPVGVPVIAGAAAMMCAIVAALGLAAGVKSAAELIVDEQKFSAAVDAFQTKTAVNTREQEFDTVEAEAAKILKYKPEL